jgi:enoyl-CoA hydratase/carnithine racemase
MACDLRTIAPDAWLQFPSSRYGLNLTAVWLSLAAGQATAAELLGSARRVVADEALRLGLVQAVVIADDAVDVLGLCEGKGLRELKAALRSALPPHVAVALALECERAVDLVETALSPCSATSAASAVRRPRLRRAAGRVPPFAGSRGRSCPRPSEWRRGPRLPPAAWRRSRAVRTRSPPRSAGIRHG